MVAILYISHKLEEIRELCDEPRFFAMARSWHCRPQPIDSTGIGYAMIGRSILN